MTSDSTPAPGSILSGLDKASAILMAVLTLVATARAVSPWPFPEAFGAGLAVAYLLAAVLVVRPASRFVALALLTLSLIIAVADGGLPEVVEGLDRAVLFAGFLAVVSMIRQVARRDPAIQAYRRRLDAQTRLDEGSGRGGSRRPKILSGAFVVGGFLSMGSSALFATLLPDGAEEAQRASEARACATGTALAVHWSPFFVGMAMVSANLPEAPLAGLILGGGLLGFMGLVIYSLLDSGIDGPPQVIRGFALARRLLLPVVFAALCIAAVSELGRMSTLEAMVIVLPILCLFRLSRIGPLRLNLLAADLGEDMLRLRGELVVVCTAMVLGTVVAGSSLPALAGDVANLDGLPPFLLSLGGILGMAAAASTGLHPLICGTIALGIFAGSDHALSILQVGLTVLVGWGLCTMLSVSAFLMQVTAGQYRTTASRLLAPRQFLFLAVHAPLAALAIAFLAG